MKKGKIYEGVIKTVDFPNKGKVFLPEEGKTVIVKNGVPGQKIRFSVNKIRQGKAEGRILKILENAPTEIEPACPHFGQCGGCTYQNLPYKEQIALKESQIKRMMDEAVNGDYVWDGMKESPAKEAYRNKMEFSFGDEYKEGPLALGMHKRGSFHDIVNVTDCKIVDEDYRKILGCTLDYAKKSRLPYFHRMKHIGFFRHLLVRKAAKTGEILIDLVTTSQGEEEFEIWVKALLNLPLDGRIVGILHTRNDGVADMVKDEGTEILYGQDYFFEELLGMKFKITPFSFFQTNSLGAEVLYETVREYIGDTKDKVIFDLYSGTGTIAQILALVAKKVVGVEIVEEAVEAAKENAELNMLDNCTFWEGDVLKVIDSLKEVPDIIVLDPPRDGVNPKALEKIIQFGVDKIVYISCKPTSLARDLEMLQGCGYQAERIACVDLFPGTYHVETVVLLSQQKPDDTIEIDLDLDELDATSAELKATYQEIKDYVLKEFGLKVSSLYISQIKRKCGIEVGENYNLPKSENARVPQCPKEKEEAIKAALKYFAMI